MFLFLLFTHQTSIAPLDLSVLSADTNYKDSQTQIRSLRQREGEREWSTTATEDQSDQIHTMASPLLLLSLLFLLFLSLGNGAQIIGGGVANAVACNGSVAECSAEEEFLMESEISRRFLASGKQISYDALKPDRPACGGGSGESYSKNGGCLPQPSNQDRRGCEKYYKCRN